MDNAKPDITGASGNQDHTYNPAPLIETVGRLAVLCEIYSRVSGYFRPVRQWNPGKKSEFADRKFAHVTRDAVSERGDN